MIHRSPLGLTSSLSQLPNVGCQRLTNPAIVSDGRKLLKPKITPAAWCSPHPVTSQYRGWKWSAPLLRGDRTTLKGYPSSKIPAVEAATEHAPQLNFSLCNPAVLSPCQVFFPDLLPRNPFMQISDSISRKLDLRSWTSPSFSQLLTAVEWASTPYLLGNLGWLLNLSSVFFLIYRIPTQITTTVIKLTFPVLPSFYEN